MKGARAAPEAWAPEHRPGGGFSILPIAAMQGYSGSRILGPAGLFRWLWGRVRWTLGKLSWAPGREHVPVLEPSVAGESPWLNWERDHYVTKSLRPAVPPSALDLGAEALEAPARLGGR